MPFGNTYPVIELDSRHVNDVEVQPVVLSQGDSNGRILKYALWDGQDAMSGTGLTARFCIDQDSGLYTSMTAVAGASTATFQAAVPMGGVEAGWHVGCIRVTDSGGRVINTRTFKVYVEKAVVGGSAEQITAYADIIAGAESATDAATDAATLANNAAASAIAASGNRLGGTIDGTGTPDTAEDAWTGPILGATVYGLSTQDGTPTPSTPVEIKSVEAAVAELRGVNLYRQTYYSSGSHTGQGITWTLNDDGSWTASGTATAAAWCYGGGSSVNTSFYVLLPAGTYTASVGGGGRRWTARKIQNGTQVIVYNTGEADSYTFALTEPTYVNVIPIVANGATVSNLVYYPQITLGSTVQPYVPYQATTTALLPSTAAPLRSLPDGTRDELVVERDGTVTVTRRVGRLLIDGTNVTVNLDSNTPGMASLRVNAITGAYASGTISANKFVLDHFVAATSTTALGNARIAAINNNYCYLIMHVDNSSTAAQLNTWFASNPTELLVSLEGNSTTETLPSVTMPTAPSRNLTAWVDATDGDGAAMASPWEVEYERDITYVIEQLEQAIADL